MWARIENDTVLEVTNTDPEGRFHPSIEWVKVPASTEAGMVKSGSRYKHPEPPAEPVPESVSRFQARAALYQSGKLDDVEQAIADADAITQMAWQDAQEFRRNSPTILALGEALSLDLDALFIAAAKIEA